MYFVMKTDSSGAALRMTLCDSTLLKIRVLNFRVVDFLGFTLICCHPEFISGSYYLHRSAKYCQNRFFGRCPQNDVMFFASTLPKIRRNDEECLTSY